MSTYQSIDEEIRITWGGTCDAKSVATSHPRNDSGSVGTHS